MYNIVIVIIIAVCITILKKIILMMSVILVITIIIIISISISITTIVIIITFASPSIPIFSLTLASSSLYFSLPAKIVPKAEQIKDASAFLRMRTSEKRACLRASGNNENI